MQLHLFIDAQRAFSESTFGPGQRLEGVTAHIEKEVAEVRDSGGKDLSEWADVIILALDGAWRSGFSAVEIEDALAAKLAKNRARAWLERQPDTFEGSRDNTGYAVACRFYDFGCSAATCRELLDEWNEKKCFPSLSDDDIDRIVSSALTSRQDVPAGRHRPRQSRRRGRPC